MTRAEVNQLTAAQIRSLLRERISALQGDRQQTLAAEIGVSRSFLSDVLNERREPTGKVLEYLGFERVVTYRRVRR
jgi:transcriptional regulator with XRE-family HTH domain